MPSRKAESANPLGSPGWLEAVESRRVCRALHPFAIADGLGITPEELIVAMRKEAGVREKSNGERAENDE